MKHKLFHQGLFIGVAVITSLSYGQAWQGPNAKKPRTIEDYKLSTLKEIAREDPKLDGLLPFRARVIYEASTRPISKSNNSALHHWAQCCAGNPDHYTKVYLREMRFVENGKPHWVPVQERLVAAFQSELKFGDAVDLFLIRVSPRGTDGKRVALLLVERVQRVWTKSDQKASLDWIRNNLPAYAGRDMTVEVPEPCKLRVTDLTAGAGVTKAIVWIPLIDLDASKIIVESQEASHMWALWLHTIAAKNSIRFILYQGGPAEGGEAGKYSLTFREQKKAEAMAEAFRHAIIICAGEPAG